MLEFVIVVSSIEDIFNKVFSWFFEEFSIFNDVEFIWWNVEFGDDIILLEDKEFLFFDKIMDVDIIIFGWKNFDFLKVLDNIEFEVFVMCDDIMVVIECVMGLMVFKEEDDGLVDKIGSFGLNCVIIFFVVGIIWCELDRWGVVVVGIELGVSMEIGRDRVEFVVFSVSLGVIDVSLFIVVEGKCVFVSILLIV